MPADRSAQLCGARNYAEFVRWFVGITVFINKLARATGFLAPHNLWLPSLSSWQQEEAASDPV
jgi:hypothetical protein